LTTEWLPFGEGGVWQGYGAWPTRAPDSLPTVMVVQEAWGVDAHIEDVTRRFAAAGYFAFAPDLFSKQGTRPTPLSAERIAETIDFISSLTPAQRGDPASRAAELTKLPADASARLVHRLALGAPGALGPPRRPDARRASQDLAAPDRLALPRADSLRRDRAREGGD
jgi:carboxymethylenebutenolidase